ncbi:MAG: IS1595 family transposase [Deltaproteobacteria bacterium]|jgi:hypothetical protein|nr:IS1595 family transposase [Deltaproteobacteria bacterium]
MAQNPVQFQDGLSVHEFLEHYGTEEQCRSALENARWPNGFVCRNCGSRTYCYVRSRKLFQCNRCHHQTTVTRDTVFHSTKTPLTKWFLAMFFISQSKNGISILELKRHLGVAYQTAWSIKHKLMQVMLERDEKKRLSRIIEADDAYLGGEKPGGKRGRGSENKQPFIAAVETDDKNHPIYLKLTPLISFTKKEIKAWAKKYLSKDSIVVTDGFRCFNGFDEANYNHVARVIGKGNKSTNDPSFNWVNTVLGNVKNAITGTYHSSRAGYASRYLAEFQYRFNRRFNLRAMMPRLIRASVATPPLPGSLLKLAANFR